MLVFVPVYFISLLLVMSFVDAAVRLDDRILSPIFIALVLSLIQFGHSLWRKAGTRSRQLSLLLIAVPLIAGPVLKGGVWFLRHPGNEFYDQMALSPVVRAVQSIERKRPIFSNAPDIVYLATGRGVMSVPGEFDETRRQRNQDYTFKLNAMRKLLVANKGVVIYLTRLPAPRPYLASVEDLTTSLGLVVKMRTPEGLVLGP